MFGWVGRTLAGRRIRELEGKLEDKTYDYARLIRDCDAQHHNILKLRERLERQDRLIAHLEDDKYSCPSRDPVTGRYMKRTDTRSIPADNKFSGDSLRGSLSYEPPRH